ncbi:MAG: hypothetical protein ABH864_04995 [archaeon]
MKITQETNEIQRKMLTSLVKLTETIDDPERYFNPSEIVWNYDNPEPRTRGHESEIHSFLEPYVERGFVQRVKFSRGNGFPRVYRANLSKKEEFVEELV